MCESLVPSLCRWLFQQLVAGLDYLHRMGIANRDVKMDNILLDTNPRPLLKICDLGFSKHNEYQSSPKSMVGTLNYTAPEVLQSGSYDGKVVPTCQRAWKSANAPLRRWLVTLAAATDKRHLVLWRRAVCHDDGRSSFFKTRRRQRCVEISKNHTGKFPARVGE